ncbi:MAG: S8 family serine peptidase [Pseudomonadota bacterium]
MTIRHTAAALVAAISLLAVPLAASAGVIEPELLTAAQAKPEVDFVLLLSEKADLTAATANAKTKKEKGAATVAALKATAASSQGPVLAALQSRGLPHRAFWLANAITAKGSLADIQALAGRLDVRGAYLISTELNLLSPYIARRAAAVQAASGKTDYVAKALGDTAEYGLRQLRAPAVWKLGFTGQGVVVGDHDVGVMWDHPALKNQYRGWDAATSTASHAYNWRNAFGAADAFCTDPVVPCDSNGHGTHTTGTIVGFDGADNQVGMAPDAKWMACRSLLDPVLGVGTVPTYMDCMEWQVAPYPEGDAASADPAMAPDVVSNSWGCLEACAPPLLKDANDAIYAAGIVQVVSGGNDGDTCSTVAFPIAVYESSFTVGANDEGEAMADFSSRGPVLSDASMRLKPNVTAPGVDTRSAWNDGDYNTISGTSMAGPHVVGLVALLMSAEPRLIGRVADVRKLVELSAVQTITTVQTCGGTAVSDIPNNISGWGRVDALNAVTMRPQLNVAITAPATAKVGEDYIAMVTISQPATGKLDATEVLLDLQSSSNATFTYSDSIDAIAPGESKTVPVTVRGISAGEVTLTAVAEAAQVSPGTAVNAKTLVGSAAAGPTTPMVTPPASGVSDGSDAGRFGGGALGGLLLAMLGLGAALRRQRS